MHMSGISNGGMLLWNIAAQVPDGFGFATFNTIAASPQLGFGLPTFGNWQKFSFIDMHGLEDITIPTNLNSAYGPSPYDGLMSKHGSYFEDKEKYLKKWSDLRKQLRIFKIFLDQREIREYMSKPILPEHYIFFSTLSFIRRKPYLFIYY